MAKNITYFDREHTGGINLAAMEDTQLKENLVQDVAAGGEEAPTATAVKEAVDVKMDKADIVNDLTTGGTDKALSAEQGKVLEDKKVDKLTEATDLVYVHGSDGTEQGKALSEFVVDTDIVNDITTGGTDKVLSAEQGKVLEGKKVDKLTDANDMVYVHEADGTESGKALSDFVVDADIVNDRTTGGADKVLAAEVGKNIPAFFNLPLEADAYPLTAATIDYTKFTDNVMSLSTLYIHPDEIPADIKSKLKRGDFIYTVSANSLINCSASFIAIVSSANESKINATAPVVNTSLPAAGNWNGWYAFAVLSSGWDRSKTIAKTNVYITYLFDGDETLETLPSANGPMPTGGFAYSLVYIKPEDIKANRYSSVPADYIKQVDGSMLKPGDILIIVTPPTAEATKKVREIYCIISHTAQSTNKQLGTNTVNESLPAAGNWGGWLVGRVFTSGWDREALLSKTDSTKMQSYFVLLPDDSMTIESMPDLNTFNSDKGVMHSNFFVHPNDIADISGTLKKGDIVNFLGKNLPDGKVFGALSALYAGYINDGSIPNDDVTINVTDPDGGNFNGWHAFAMLSSAYGRVQMSKKLQQYSTTLRSTGKTWPTMPDARNYVTKGIVNSTVYIHPDDISDIANKVKIGDTLVCNATSSDSTGKYLYSMILQYKRMGTVNDKLNSNILNDTLPAEGSFDSWLCFSIITNGYEEKVMRSKPNFFAMTSTAGGSNIPKGLKSLETIAFAPSHDTASFAHALKEGDLIEVRDFSDVMYTLMFIRYANSADNVNNKKMIVGQVTEPADMTGYLWCRVIASRSDVTNEIVYETNKYQFSQFKVGKYYDMNLKVTGTSDRLYLYDLGIDSTTFEEYNCVLRRSFKVGTIFILHVPNAMHKVVLLVHSNSFTASDNFIRVICLAKNDENMATTLG